MYKETNLTSDFSKYLNHHPHAITHSCGIEFKVINTTKYKNKQTPRLNFKSHLRPHQAPTLFKAQYKHIYHKLSDLASMGGNLPFDAFLLYKAPSYLAVCFYTPRKPKHLHFISAGTLASLIMSTKSLTDEQCKQYADFTLTL